MSCCELYALIQGKLRSITLNLVVYYFSLHNRRCENVYNDLIDNVKSSFVTFVRSPNIRFSDIQRCVF